MMDFVERLFWTVAIFVGVHFIWLAWLERDFSIQIGTVVAVVLSVGFFLAALKLFPYEEKE